MNYSSSNRVAARLAGCPDPGGVLFLPAPAERKERRLPVLTVGHVVLPAGGLPVRELAALLGLPAWVVVRELIALGVFSSSKAHLDFATARQICVHLGVSVTTAT